MFLKKSRLFGCLLAICVIFTIISIPAFARSTTCWTDNAGTHTAIADAEITSWKMKPLKDYSCCVDHTKGSTNHVALHSSFKQPLDVEFEGEKPSYTEQMKQVLRSEGVLYSYTAQMDINSPKKDGWVEIPANLPTGKYMVGLNYKYKEGSWSIENGAIFSLGDEQYSVSLPEQGRFSNGPTGDWYICACPV